MWPWERDTSEEINFDSVFLSLCEMNEKNLFLNTQGKFIVKKKYVPLTVNWF